MRIQYEDHYGYDVDDGEIDAVVDGEVDVDDGEVEAVVDGNDLSGADQPCYQEVTN